MERPLGVCANEIGLVVGGRALSSFCVPDDLNYLVSTIFFDCPYLSIDTLIPQVVGTVPSIDCGGLYFSPSLHYDSAYVRVYRRKIAPGV